MTSDSSKYQCYTWIPRSYCHNVQWEVFPEFNAYLCKLCLTYIFLKLSGKKIHISAIFNTSFWHEHVIDNFIMGALYSGGGAQWGSVRGRERGSVHSASYSGGGVQTGAQWVGSRGGSLYSVAP